MPNPGNTGKRYVFRHIATAEVSPRGGVTFTLDCGHIIPPYEPADPPKPWDYIWTQEKANADIGLRQKCEQCGKARRSTNRA